MVNKQDDNDATVRHGHNSQMYRPLTWSEARSQLRHTLNLYVNAKPTTQDMIMLRKRAENQKAPNPKGTFVSVCSRCLGFWLAYDLDVLLAFFLAAGLLVLSIFSYLQGDSSEERENVSDKSLNAKADPKVYKAQIASSAFLAFGSFMSLVISFKRKQTSLYDSFIAKRRVVVSFLRMLENLGSEDAKSWHASDCRDSRTGESMQRMQLSGTPLTDIYSAYRLPSYDNGDAPSSLPPSRVDSSAEGEWHKIPALLLVKGDIIALQVGDIAPAKCVLIPSSHVLFEDGSGLPNGMSKQDDNIPHVRDGGDSSTSIDRADHRIDPGRSFWTTVLADEKITKDLLCQGQNTMQPINDHTLFGFPKGKLTLRPQSKELLSLCNDMRIFTLCESPIGTFLHREDVGHRSPHIHRQGLAIRGTLQIAALIALILTTIFIFVRPGIISTDLSLLLPLPLLASLGVLPVATPICMFLFEVIGSSRILATAHRFASRIGSSKRGRETILQGTDSQITLFIRYCFATMYARLSRRSDQCSAFSWCHFPFRGANRQYEYSQAVEDLIKVPPASAFMLESLGVVTALALIDDELASESFSTPQQLLIPSGNDLKLLDLCPNLGNEAGSFDSEKSVGKSKRRTKSAGSSNDSDSDDSDDEQKYQHISAPKRTFKALQRRYTKKSSGCLNKEGLDLPESRRPESTLVTDGYEVQFEDPLWWQHLPSLKCIGLACLLVGGSDNNDEDFDADKLADAAKGKGGDWEIVRRNLVKHICHNQSRSHLISLAQCIGFSVRENSFGPRGDISPFTKRRWLHVVSTRLVHDRLSLDRHAIGLEESRNWGLLRPDSTSIVIQDHRSKAYQLLTVGDARVVTEFCVDSWQGENSTISPLSNVDRQIILETSRNWSLADLDVAAFSYAPIPSPVEERIKGAHGGIGVNSSSNSRKSYLVDNKGNFPLPQKDVATDDWAMVKNQIFLGLLGSAVIPRKEIEPLIDEFTAAGIRFVYFSPRNMRRTKELASQMGIDVAWNCAISLRVLDDGQDDPHRMTSTYADWDVNAKLPHGVEEVKRHLEEVDNVPLLVSLYTDVTKETTAEMVDVFQEYNDTVLSIGLSHLSHNERIFSTADMSIGVDVLTDDVRSSESNLTNTQESTAREWNCLHPLEASFVTSLASHSSVFNLLGSSSISHVPEIIAHSRAALDAVTSGGIFVITSYLSFSLLVLSCPCTVATSVPIAPAVGSSICLQVMLPAMGVILSMTEADTNSMNRVPPKNDKTVVFAEGEGRRIYLYAIARALPPAVASHLLYLIALGALVSKFEPSIVESVCTSKYLIRCEALKHYSGPARTSASSLMVAELMLCILAYSAGFVFRTKSLKVEKPWKRNKLWLWGVVVGILVVFSYLAAALEPGSLSALPWYFFVFGLFVFPLLCLAIVEIVKLSDCRYEDRAERLRRLQYETRLGMWSPK